MKKYLLLLIALLVMTMASIPSLGAKEAEEYVPLIDYEGNYVTYTDTGEKVMMPTEYHQQETYLRGVWVTPLAGNISGFKDINSYKAEINQMFDVMEYYNLNAVIFHVRIMNDALYASNLNPRSNYMNTDWDAIKWVIDECHKRGIEFHAWMNPYRVKASGGSNAVSEAASIKSRQPNNIGSNPNNLLVSTKGGVILNPGLQVVRDFLVDTVLEFMKMYDTDAIHFDDYFYISDIDDTTTYNANNPQGLGLYDWRRHQCDLFIEQLSNAMRAYNKENNTNVQLGISPTGIYRNGDGAVTYDEQGNAISLGSATGGQEHYQSYLFSDTVNWINHEWIDYITPQSYWAFTHSIAGFADVMGWWNKIVEYKDVNLYSGMGIYMSGTPGTNYSWGRDPNEAYNQLLYTTTLDNVDGTVFYSYTYLKNAYLGDTTSLYGQGLAKVKKELFTKPSVLPEIGTMEPVVLPNVENFTAKQTSNGNVLTFNAVKGAKQYVLYRQKVGFDFETAEAFKILGESASSTIEYTDKVSEAYNYGVRVLSDTNSLNEGSIAHTTFYSVNFYDNDGNLITTEKVPYGQSATAPAAPEKAGHQFVGWSKDISFIKSDYNVYPKYDDSKYTVNFYKEDGTFLETKEVNRGENVQAPELTKIGYTLTGWSEDLNNIIYDLDIYPIFELNYYNVIFYDLDGNILTEQKVAYNESAIIPSAPTVEDHYFVEWSHDASKVTENLDIHPIYKLITFTVTFVLEDGTVIDVQEVEKGKAAVEPLDKMPEIKGMKFSRWLGTFDRVICDITIEAIYGDVEFEINFYDYEGNLYETIYAFYLDEIEMPEAPVKEGFEFISWDKEIKPEDIYQNIDVHPVFNVTKKFTVTYIGFDGAELGKEELAYKANATFPYQAPEKEGYAFIGWDNEGKEVTSDITITAKYEVKKYTVTYTDSDGTVLGTEIVLHGANATFAYQAPTVDGFDFTGWDSDGKLITSDITIKAQYEVKKYIVTYVTKDGNTIGSETVAHGEKPLLSIKAPEIKGFKFDKFDYNNEPVTDNITITLLYVENTSNCNTAMILRLITAMALLGLALKGIRRRH